MRASAFVYPWDVIGDPDAPARLVDLGVRQVTLASAYHSTRALTPRHPVHRVVTAPYSAVYYPPDPARWRDAPLRPHRQRWLAGDDPYQQAAQALAEAGLEVHTWVILAHNSRLGEEHPDSCVTNAYGDRYPWAPCIARPEVHAYLVTLAAEAATRPGAHGTELESCGWYGLDHRHAHDKIGGVPLDGAAQYLMSLCFCTACADGYTAAGVDPDALRVAVRDALAAHWAGAAATAQPSDARTAEAEWEAVRRLLGPEAAEASLRHRTAVARRLQREVVAAVREAAADRPDFRVLLHADPAPHRCGANVGVEPAEVLSSVDGLVLPCTGGAAARRAALTAPAAHRRRGTVLAANLTVVSGMGGSPATLARDAAEAAALGADELRLYHAGLASAQDLHLVRAALAELR